MTRCQSTPRSYFFWGSIVCALSLAILVPAPRVRADNGRGKHQKIYVVPVPAGKKVTIDGKLDDWDLSGQLLMYVTLETSEMQGARFAMMYDAEALYVAGVVRDPSPLMNRHDPKVEPQRAWDADVCQIYLCTDASLGYPYAKSGTDGAVPGLMDMYLWYYTDRKEPCLATYQALNWAPLHPDWNDKGMVPPDKFQAAYVKAADGRGYTFEYRIPWATLGAKQPLKAGDLVAGTVQFDWSDSTGLATAGGAAWAYDVMGHPGFPFQESSCWGKFIFSDKGNLSKDLVEEGLPPEKPLPLNYGFELPEDSDVTIQFFDANNVLVRTLVAADSRRAGHNVERWDGLDFEGKPLQPGTYTWKGIYHKPITGKFLFSAHNSGQPPYHTDDGTGSWGGDHGNPTSVCAVPDGEVMSWNMSEAGFGIIKTDFAGKKVWGSKHNARDLATDGHRLFVAGDGGYDAENSVKVFDLDGCRPLNWGNGKPALDAPPGGKPEDNVAAAVAFGDGKVYVSWTRRNLVGVYDATSGALTAQWDVPAPGRLAARPNAGVVVISQGKVLAVNDGKAAALISDHLDLSQDPAAILSGLTGAEGITVGPDGAIYVANGGKLQNISVFDASGKYVRSIGKEGGRPAVGRYDKTGIFQPGGITLDKNGHLWVAEATDFPKRISEWDAKTGEFVNEFFGGSGYFGWAYMDPRHADELYCHNTIWKVDWKANTCAPYSTIWRPTAPNMIGNVDPNGYNGALRVHSMKDGKQFSDGRGPFQNIVSVRDGDVFKPVADAIDLRRSGMYSIGAQYDILKDEKKYPDGTYYWVDANNDQTIQAEELNTNDADYRKAVDALWANVTDKDEIASRHIGLPNSNLVRYPDAPGSKNLWEYRGCVDWHAALNLPPLTPGNMNGLTMPLGVAGDFTGAASYFGVANIVTAEDGIYVAQIFRDARMGGGYGPDTLCSETIIGQLVKPDGMNGRYFFLGGAADGRVTEVLGLDTVKRLPGGQYTYTDEDYKHATEALMEYKALLSKSQRLTVVRGKATLDSAKPIGKTLDGARGFNARLAYDDKSLYVSYDVNSPVELINQATDPHLIFKGGNLIDLQLATDPAADANRDKPAPGDVRLLVTRQGDKPVAVLFRPKVKGFAGQPIVLTSPTGKESFDEIKTVDVGLDYQKTPTGFHALVTVPLSLLGWAPKPGEAVKIDLGYIFGNATGNAVSVRSYWTNNGFSAGVTNDVPNESRLEPKSWGSATVE